MYTQPEGRFRTVHSVSRKVQCLREMCILARSFWKCQKVHMHQIDAYSDKLNFLTLLDAHTQQRQGRIGKYEFKCGIHTACCMCANAVRMQWVWTSPLQPLHAVACHTANREKMPSETYTQLMHETVGTSASTCTYIYVWFSSRNSKRREGRGERWSNNLGWPSFPRKTESIPQTDHLEPFMN